MLLLAGWWLRPVVWMLSKNFNMFRQWEKYAALAAFTAFAAFIR
jgi:hypothetical protein